MLLLDVGKYMLYLQRAYAAEIGCGQVFWEEKQQHIFPLSVIMVTFLTNKMTGEKRDAVAASCSLSLPMVPLRENTVPVQKDRCV